VGAVYENNVLQHFVHEEGRIRDKKTSQGVHEEFVYDYFIKDHLGNTRAVVTDEIRKENYIRASMETAQASAEEQVYYNVANTRSDLPAGYPADNTTNPNQKAAKLNGNGNKMGPGIMLKVMSGDAFDFKVSSWYRLNGTTPGLPVNPATELLTALANTASAAGGGHTPVPELLSSNSLNTAVNDFLSAQEYTQTTKPKAYLNYIHLDEQFHMVPESSGSIQVGDDQEFSQIAGSDYTVTQNGYLYVYVSNETPNVDVYFDNLQVNHIHGSLIEETHYYPFGGILQAISSKALLVKDNKHKFNGGNELNTEFEWMMYEATYRNYDPQIGRFYAVDPMTEKYTSLSVYNFSFNNPILFNDPLGNDPGLDAIINQLNSYEHGGRWTPGGGAHPFNNEGEEFFYGAMYATRWNMWDDLAKQGGYSSFTNAWDEFNQGKLTPAIVAGLYSISWEGQASKISATVTQDGYYLSYNANSTGNHYDDLFQSEAWIRVQLNQILALYEKHEYSDAKIFSTTLGAFDVAWGAKSEIIGLAGEATESLKYVKGVKVVSKVSFVLSTAMSVGTVAHAWGTDNANKWGVTAKASLDVTRWRR
jgi:RHS repeat-associated protein